MLTGLFNLYNPPETLEADSSMLESEVLTKTRTGGVEQPSAIDSRNLIIFLTCRQMKPV